jgi:hypothetical protein
MSSQDGPVIDKQKSSPEASNSLERLSTGGASSKEANSLEETTLPDSVSVRDFKNIPEKLEHDKIIQRLNNVPRLESSTYDQDQERTQTQEPTNNNIATGGTAKQKTSSHKATIDLSGETVLDKLINFVASLVKILERLLLGALRRIAPDSEQVLPKHSAHRSTGVRGSTQQSQSGLGDLEAIGDQDFVTLPTEKRGAQRAGRSGKTRLSEETSGKQNLDDEEHGSGFPGQFDDD